MIKERIKAHFNKNYYERAAWEAHNVVVGIDEVGRGCLAGPVVCAAIILPPGKISSHLKDSKLMSQKERELAFAWISKHCWYGIGFTNNRLIDQHNIYQATLIAMKKALVHLLAIYPHKRPIATLVDAMPLNIDDTQFKDMPIYYFDKGERKSSSIAAASIVAKVTRDKYMNTYNTIFPGYQWHSNKGYATKVHRDAIKKDKYTIIHRLKFLGNIIQIQNNDSIEQQSFLNDTKNNPSIIKERI